MVLANQVNKILFHSNKCTVVHYQVLTAVTDDQVTDDNVPSFVFKILHKIKCFCHGVSDAWNG